MASAQSGSRKRFILPLSVVLLGVGGAVHAAPVMVPGGQLACLVENSSAYLALNKDPMIIFLAACPDPSARGAALSAGVRNSAGLTQTETPNQTDRSANTTTASGVAAATVLILTRAQLQCLVQKYAAPGAIPRDWSDGLVELDQDLCRQP